MSRHNPQITIRAATGDTPIGWTRLDPQTIARGNRAYRRSTDYAERLACALRASIDVVTSVAPSEIVRALDRLYRTEPTTITIADAARALGLSERRTREIVSAGAVVGARKVGRVWAIPRASIASMIGDAR